MPASRLVAFRARQSYGKSIAKKLPRDGCESLNGPVLGLPYGSGCHDGECFGWGHALVLQETLHITRGFRWEMNGQVWWVVIESNQRPKPEVAIDCVNVERRNRDAVRVSYP